MHVKITLIIIELGLDKKKKFNLKCDSSTKNETLQFLECESKELSKQVATSKRLLANPNAETLGSTHESSFLN